MSAPKCCESVDQTKRTFFKSFSTQNYGNNFLVYSKSLFSIFLQNISVSVTYEVHSSAEQHFPEKCFEEPQVLFVQLAFRP